MKTKPGTVARWAAMACAVMLGWAGGDARGGIAVPLYVGNLTPALDERGLPLQGMYDWDPATCDRLEVRTAADGVIRPPSTNGAPHPANPLLATNSTGVMGMNASEPGLFAMVFPLRPATGTKVFARAFNAPTLAAATFYTDSGVAMVSPSGLSLVLYFGPAQPLDPGDHDGDGLNNSWEQTLGTFDRETPDYDNDGMHDWEECRAGTDARDPTSFLAFREIARAAAAAPAEAGAASASIRLRFAATPGKRYQLGFATTLEGEPAFTPLGDVLTAGPGETELEVEAVVPPDLDRGIFRVKLVEE